MANYLLSNEEQFLRVCEFLANHAASKGINMPISRMKPTPTGLYIASQFTAGGKVSLLQNVTVKQVGVTNFDGQTLEQDRYAVIDGVTIMYGEAAPTKKVWEVDYSKDLPEVLKNSQLVVMQQNEVVISLPIEDINNAKKSEDFVRKLNALALLVPNQTIDIYVDTPVGSSITPAASGNSSFVKVILTGSETYLKR
jgi:hypothetical protein